MFGVELILLSSTPLRGRVDTTLVVVEELVDAGAFDTAVTDEFKAGVLSTEAANAAVCCRADLLSLAFVAVSWFELFLFPCSLEPSSIADFLVLLGLGEALEAGLDPFDELLLPPLLLALFAAELPFVKLKI